MAHDGPTTVILSLSATLPSCVCRLSVNLYLSISSQPNLLLFNQQL